MYANMLFARTDWLAGSKEIGKVLHLQAGEEKQNGSSSHRSFFLPQCRLKKLVLTVNHTSIEYIKRQLLRVKLLTQLGWREEHWYLKHKTLSWGHCLCVLNCLWTYYL